MTVFPVRQIVKKTIAVSTLSLIVALGILNKPVSAQDNAPKGAVLGGAAGAVIGGIVGHQNDRAGKGALIGGVAGALVGGLAGNHKDKQIQQQWEYQQAQEAQYSYQMSRAVSISDVISMSNSGLSPQVIVGQIRANGVQQEIGVQEIIMLHQNGVQEMVIQEMQRARIGSGAPVAVAQPSVIVRQPPTVFVEPAPVFVEPVPVYGYHYHVPPPRYARGYYYAR